MLILIYLIYCIFFDEIVEKCKQYYWSHSILNVYFLHTHILNTSSDQKYFSKLSNTGIFFFYYQVSGLTLFAVRRLIFSPYCIMYVFFNG